MFRQVVSEGDKYWQNFLLMLEITDILLSPEITIDEVGYLGTLISTHHETFVKIYPDNSFIPKLHYLVHTPRLISRYVTINSTVINFAVCCY